MKITQTIRNKKRQGTHVLVLFVLTILSIDINAQQISRPIVNQAGYNLHEAKRFVCYGAENGKEFIITNAKDSTQSNISPLFTGTIQNNSGEFSDFNPISTDQYVIKVENHGNSHPFWISDHLLEGLSSKLAYQFFMDVRGSENPIYSEEINVAGGGPSRDGGAYTLETLYEVLLYASNPALFDRWNEDFEDEEVPDLINLILWHGEFAYHHRDFNGATGPRPYSIGHPNEKLQNYDYQNTLDHLAAICAAKHSFLKPYLSEEKYQRYRQVLLDKWEEYERDRVVRYYVKSDKWVDKGWQEFNEMGNVFGQSVFRNLMMYITEKNEKDGDADKFMSYAKKAAKDIIENWDFNNPRHMWWIRNGEHITPQALAFFLMVAPSEAPYGTKEKLAAWAEHIKDKTANFWHYRKHSKTEWAHPKTKELGNSGLGGSIFAVAHLLDDDALRAIGWSQVNQVFGMNPAEAHYSNKSEERVAIDGYWKGIEKGWPIAHKDGYGKLGRVRGTLDGTPLDHMFPYNPQNTDIKYDKNSKQPVSFAYATEGWAVTNRAWMSTITFVTLGSHELKIFTENHQKEVIRPKSGETITIQLKAALNLDWKKKETGWVLLKIGEEEPIKIAVLETDKNSGIFTAKHRVDAAPETKVNISYGYLGFGKEINFLVSD